MSLTVGVLGGLGPEATLDFYAKLLRATPAARDQDHLRVLLDVNPQVPDRNAALAGTGPSPAPALIGMARGLEGAGADFLVLVCNTAHAWAAELQAAVDIPLVSLIGETVDEVARAGAERVGLLAADGALRAGLYQTALAERGLDVLALSEAGQMRFMQLLYRIKAGHTGEAERAEMRALAAQLLDQGADLILAGCTEVPLVLDQDDVSVPLVSSTDVLVRRTVVYATGEASLPTGPARPESGRAGP